jgi:DNA-binding transcriptional LysR family regulator
MEMLDLNDISLFVQVVRFGSFSEAGRRLGIPANTVSRRIQELEQRLGARLMQRSTRKLQLTDAGCELYGNSAGPFGDYIHLCPSALYPSPELSGFRSSTTIASYVWRLRKLERCHDSQIRNFPQANCQGTAPRERLGCS